LFCTKTKGFNNLVHSKQDKHNRESERGQQDYIERLKQKIADLESQKTELGFMSVLCQIMAICQFVPSVR
jgi:hypothetical protein